MYVLYIKSIYNDLNSLQLSHKNKENDMMNHKKIVSEVKNIIKTIQMSYIAPGRGGECVKEAVNKIKKTHL